MKVLTWQAELTDTFGGEANYSWVRRVSFETGADATRRQIVRAGKAALGITGDRCVTSDLGDGFELRLVGSCTVAFITLEA
jgi:hypothetical protein